MGTISGYGNTTLNTLYEYGVRTVLDVYQLKFDDYINAGFGEKTANNLLHNLEQSRLIPTESETFIGSFGLHLLGIGRALKILQVYAFEQLFEISVEDLIKVDGIAEPSAIIIHEGLLSVRPMFEKLYALGFNLEHPTLLSEIEEQSDNPLAGLGVVFTGKMMSGSRAELGKQAQKKGLLPLKKISGSCSYLVCGSKVGVTKINDAKKKNVKVITEDEYLEMMKVAV